MSPPLELSPEDLETLNGERLVNKKYQPVRMFFEEGEPESAESMRLVIRRLMGIALAEREGRFAGDFLEDDIEGLDYYKLAEDRTLLSELIQRFLGTEEPIVIQSMTDYVDTDTDHWKWNVKIIGVVMGEAIRRTIILKYIDESPRREYLALRLNNILTDTPLPFLGRRNTMLQMGVNGLEMGLALNSGEWEPRRFSFELGRADEVARMFQLCERGGNNVMLTQGQAFRLINIDFGSAFSQHASMRFYLQRIGGNLEDFELGRQTTQATVRARYARYAGLVQRLLEPIDDQFVALANQENQRGDNPIRNPKTILEDYLRSIGCELK